MLNAEKGQAQNLDGAQHFLRSEEHTSELQSQSNLVCRLLLEKKKRLNSSHSQMSYAVFCLKKKKRSISPIHSTRQLATPSTQGIDENTPRRLKTHDSIGYKST